MQLLALTEGDDHVCYRYRVAPFASALRQAGWRLRCEPLAKAAWARGRQLRRAAQADVVLLQRKLLPWWQLRTLRRSAKALVFDFDDAIFHRDSYHPKGIDSWQRMAHFWTTVYAADLVLAGNRYLYDQAAAFIGPERVRLVPTCVEPQKYSLSDHGAGDTLKLVWIGQRSTVRSLEKMHEPLRAAAAACCFDLHVISDVFPDLAGVRVKPIVWSGATETAQLAAAHIGISWLPDDRWSRGKCGLKVLQYMAAGLPVVANRVGVHGEIIVDGVTGFLADTPREWRAAIERLSNDAGLRASMGGAARQRVEAEYSVARWAQPFAEAIDGLVQPRRDLTPRAGPASLRAPAHHVEASGVRRQASGRSRDAHGPDASNLTPDVYCWWAGARQLAGRTLRSAAYGAVLACLPLGCMGLGRHANPLPIKHTLVLDPLVVYSDFALPPHHRLLEELVLERNELLAKLQLPKSAEPVNVYLFDTEERYRDFVRQYYPEFPQRRAFFVESDTRLAVYAQWGDRVAEDLRHEVAHGYLHSVVPNLPLWLDEGLAEYAEVPRGHAGLNRPHVRLLLERLAKLSWKPDLVRLERLTSASEMTQLDYAESWAWVHWLMEHDPARRQIVQGYLDELRNGEMVPPFSMRLHNWFPQPGPMLVAHLHELEPSLR